MRCSSTNRTRSAINLSAVPHPFPRVRRQLVRHWPYHVASPQPRRIRVHCNNGEGTDAKQNKHQGRGQRIGVHRIRVKRAMKAERVDRAGRKSVQAHKRERKESQRLTRQQQVANAHGCIVATKELCMPPLPPPSLGVQRLRDAASAAGTGSPGIG